MAVIPEVVACSEFNRRLVALGYILLYRGKVGELYDTGRNGQVLMVRSDRLSIFDFVLPCLVPKKGEVLIALTHYWLTQVFPNVPNHLLAWGGQNDRWSNTGWNSEDVAKLPLERTILVEQCKIWPYEMVYRAHIGGSVWKQYLENGTAGGNQLPLGLSKWQKLDAPIFTPTSKAETGHDIAMSVNDYAARTGEPGTRLAAVGQDIYKEAYQHAAEHGILILDTKFEISPSGKLVDEVLTPDSSRFTTTEDLVAAIREGRDPIFYDKQPVRDWGKTVETDWGVGLQNLDPANDEHLAFVANLNIPTGVVGETTTRYLDIFQRITGMDLHTYQLEVMQTPELN